MKVHSRFLGRALAIFLLMLVVAVGGFVLWGSTPLGPSAEAVAALRSDGSVVVTDAQWLTFAPASTTPVAGLVFYPGGRVDSRAYAPSARALAARGLLVVIVPMPLNLAVFAPGRAAEVIAAHPEVAVWAVGGHSLGGAMAAAFAGNHPDAVEGLVLWAAYPASGNDLSGRDDLAVLSVYATLDGLMTEAERTASASLLPGTACWVALDWRQPCSIRFLRGAARRSSGDAFRRCAAGSDRQCNGCVPARAAIVRWRRRCDVSVGGRRPLKRG